MIVIVRELITRFGFQLDQTQVNRAERATNNLKQSANTAATVFGRLAFAIGSAFSVKKIITTADDMQNLRARIGMLPQTVGDVGAAFDEVGRRASESGMSIDAYATLYSRVGNAAQDYIKTQGDLLKVTDTISKALVVGGTSTAEASAVMIQFSQALASGVLQGDEFRSMAEAAPQYLQKLSEELNIPRQNLKKMASEGKLAAKDVIEATKRMADYFDLKFKSMPMTVGRAMTIVGNRFSLMIDRMNRDTDFVRSIAEKIIAAFDAIEGGIKTLVAAFGGWNNMLRIIGITIATILGVKAIAAIIAFGAISWGALLPWLAMAAAVTALALLIEDVVVWVNGGNSAIGEMLGKWDDVRYIFVAIKLAVIDLFKWAGNVLGAIGAMIVGILTLDPALFAQGLAGLTNILMTTLRDWGDAIYKMWFDPIVQAVKDALAFVKNAISSVWSTAKAAMGITEGQPINRLPISAGFEPQPFRVSSIGGRPSIQNSTTVNVTVPPGTTAEQAGFLKRTASASFGKAADNELARGISVYSP